MVDQKRFNGQVGFTNDVQIKIAGDGGEGPTGVLFGKNATDKADPYQESATALFTLGTELIYGDRAYRYARMGSGGVTQGKLLQTAALHADTKDISPKTDTAIGSKTLVVTLGGTGTGDLAADFFRDGYVVVNNEAGEGFAYRIKSSTAADVSESLDVSLTLYEGLQVAVTNAASTLDLFVNPYAGLQEAPTTETGAVVGLTSMSMTANYYGWVQTKGPAAVLSNGVLVTGDAAVRSTAVAGAAMPAAAATSAKIGTVIHANGDTDYSFVQLDI